MVAPKEVTRQREAEQERVNVSKVTINRSIFSCDISQPVAAGQIAAGKEDHLREILFRGKSIDNGEWVEGFYYNLSETTYAIAEDYERNPVPIHHYILFGRMTDWGMPNQLYRIEVDPKTICQYTGKPDDNGNKIWEEDFVKINDEWIGRVVWRDDVTAFCVFPNDDIEHETYCLGFYLEEGYKVEVIGNIFDNSELITEDV